MSSQPDHENVEKNIVCECNNVCNRKAGRGSCVCLRNSQKCSRRCACGTEKMVCQNRAIGIKQEPEEEEETDNVVSTPDQDGTPQNTASPQKIALFARKKGKKRKGYGTGKSSDSSGEWTPSRVQEDIPPSMRPWLVLGEVGNIVYCRFCRIKLIRKGNMVMLTQHSKSKKHERNAERWAQSGRSLMSPLEDIADVEYDDHSRKPNSRKSKHSKPGTDANPPEQSEDMDRKRRKVLRQPPDEEEPSATPSRGGMSRISNDEVNADKDSDTEGPDDREAVLVSADEVSKQAREIQAAVVSFMVENNVPLDKTKPLVTCLKDLPSPGLAIERMTLGQEDAVDMLTQTSVNVVDDLLIARLKTTLFSIVIDVQMDANGGIYLAVFVFFSSEDLRIQLFCLAVVDIGDRSAETIYRRLKESLNKKEEQGVPLSNWIGLLCDTPNVPFDTMAGVVALVKPDYPWVMPVVSLGHMPDLSIIPVLREVIPPRLDQFCRLVNAHFLAGPELGVSYLDSQKFCELKSHPVVADSDLPWAASEEFLSSLLDQWKILQLYFQDVHQLRSARPTPGNNQDEDIRSILEALSDPIMKVWCYLVRFVIGLVKSKSTQIAQEAPFFQSIFRETVELIRTFANFFMTKESLAAAGDLATLDVDDPGSCLPLPEVYLGIEAGGVLFTHMRELDLNPLDDGRMEFLQSVRALHRGFVRNLQARLALVRPTWQLGSLMSSQNLINHGSLALHSDEVLAPFKAAAGSIDVEAVHREIETLMTDAAVQASAISSPPEDFWRYLLTARRETCPNLWRVILFFSSLPLSTASVAGVFRPVKNWNVDAYLRLRAANVDEYLAGNVPMRALLEGRSGGVTEA